MTPERQQDLFEQSSDSVAREGAFDAQLSFTIPSAPAPEPIHTVVKRNGREAPFETSKIADAIHRAATSTGEDDPDLARHLAASVALFLSKRVSAGPPSVDAINDAVEEVLVAMGHPRTAFAFTRYRDRRTRIRHLREGDMDIVLGELEEARRHHNGHLPSRGLSLFVRTSDDRLDNWNRAKIVETLVREVDLDEGTAEIIAAEVEGQIAKAGVETLTASLVRELVDAKLIEMGREDLRQRHMRLGVPLYDAEQIICAPNADEGTGGYDPRATDELLAQRVKKEFALTRVFSRDVADAHLCGDLHLHDLAHVDRLRSSRQSMGLVTHVGPPAKNGRAKGLRPAYLENVFAHWTACHEALRHFHSRPAAWDALDVFMAPYFEESSPRAARETAQQFLSAAADPHGDPVEFSLYWDIPSALHDAPVPDRHGGCTATNYGDLILLARRWAWAVLSEATEGDVASGMWGTPLLALRVTDTLFNEGSGLDFLSAAAGAAAHGANIAFDLIREEDDDSAPPQPWQPTHVLAHLATINLPRAAYNAKGDTDALLDEVDRLVELAAAAHKQKHDFLHQLLGLGDIGPMALLARPWNGEPLLDLQRATWGVGLVGLNECVQHMTDQQLHEDIRPMNLAKGISERVAAACARWTEDLELRVTPAHCRDTDARRRLADLDSRDHPLAARHVVKFEGLTPEVAYTAGAEAAIGAPMSAMERAAVEGVFHAHAPEQAITTIPLPDDDTSPEALTQLLHTIHTRTTNRRIIFQRQ
jgi:ribonucleoside-triphosphate reductase